MLAEQALDSFRAAAGTLFSKSELRGEERWAVGLERALAEAEPEKMTIKKLQERLDIQDDVVNSWVTLKQRVPQDMQKLIVTALGRSAAELFTDVQPTSKKGGQGNVQTSTNEGQNP